MIDAYINGDKIALGESVPIYQGKVGEDLNSLNTTQTRIYRTALSSVKNAPVSIGSWFTVDVRMQDASNGIMILFSNSGQVFSRTCGPHVWGKWKELAFK